MLNRYPHGFRYAGLDVPDAVSVRGVQGEDIAGRLFHKDSRRDCSHHLADQDAHAGCHGSKTLMLFALSQNDTAGLYSSMAM